LYIGIAAYSSFGIMLYLWQF